MPARRAAPLIIRTTDVVRQLPPQRSSGLGEGAEQVGPPSSSSLRDTPRRACELFPRMASQATSSARTSMLCSSEPWMANYGAFACLVGLRAMKRNHNTPVFDRNVGDSEGDKLGAAAGGPKPQEKHRPITNANGRIGAAFSEAMQNWRKERLGLALGRVAPHPNSSASDSRDRQVLQIELKANLSMCIGDRGVPLRCRLRPGTARPDGSFRLGAGRLRPSHRPARFPWADDARRGAPGWSSPPIIWSGGRYTSRMTRPARLFGRSAGHNQVIGALAQSLGGSVPGTTTWPCALKCSAMRLSLSGQSQKLNILINYELYGTLQLVAFAAHSLSIDTANPGISRPPCVRGGGRRWFS